MKLKQAQLQQSEKPKGKPLRVGYPARIAFVLVLVVTASLAKDIYWQIQLGRQEKQNQQTLNSLAARYEALSRTHERLMTDDDYVEGLIRSTFKFARPGELVIPLEKSDSKIIAISLED